MNHSKPGICTIDLLAELIRTSDDNVLYSGRPVAGITDATLIKARYYQLVPVPGKGIYVSVTECILLDEEKVDQSDDVQCDLAFPIKHMDADDVDFYMVVPKVRCRWQVALNEDGSPAKDMRILALAEQSAQIEKAVNQLIDRDGLKPL